MAVKMIKENVDYRTYVRELAKKLKASIYVDKVYTIVNIWNIYLKVTLKHTTVTRKLLYWAGR